MTRPMITCCHRTVLYRFCADEADFGVIFSKFSRKADRKIVIGKGLR